jgi:glucokinase
MEYFVGIDLGGTNIKSGVVDGNGKPLSKLSVTTPAESGPEAVMQAMASAARQATAAAGISMSQVTGIGMGAPGPLDLEAGVVRSAPNMAGWIDVPIRRRVSELLGQPCVLENDANAAGFGEYWCGAGRQLPNVKHLVMITLGTGIGSGIVINGEVLHGTYTMAGEAGHVIIVPGGRQCACGQRGCIEAYASATNTAKRAIEAVQAGGKTTLAEAFKGRVDQITSKDVFDHAKAGDKFATQIVDETGYYLGILCVNICRFFDPQMIVFAGGMIHAGDHLFDIIRSSFADNTWTVVKDHVQIVPALLGNDAGFIGAAGVAWNEKRQGRLK